MSIHPGKRKELGVDSKVVEWVPVPRFLEANKGKIDRNLLYRLISDGSVPSVRLGTKKLLVPSNLFDILLDQAQQRD